MGSVVGVPAVAVSAVCVHARHMDPNFGLVGLPKDDGASSPEFGHAGGIFGSDERLRTHTHALGRSVVGHVDLVLCRHRHAVQWAEGGTCSIARARSLCLSKNIRWKDVHNRTQVVALVRVLHCSNEAVCHVGGRALAAEVCMVVVCNCVEAEALYRALHSLLRSKHSFHDLFHAHCRRRFLLAREVARKECRHLLNEEVLQFSHGDRVLRHRPQEHRRLHEKSDNPQQGPLQPCAAVCCLEELALGINGSGLSSGEQPHACEHGACCCQRPQEAERQRHHRGNYSCL
mmetsp:Transcript_12237/g.49130  ORF Transcript_12237/g.49130 Transcript_12237/m.49130 type:complete len:288 (-) Transcript_12237:25-888(-)